MKKMHEPIRECISCGRKFPKASLMRIVQNESGIFLDESSRANGRGAYLCRDSACLEKLVRQKRLNRAFKRQIDEDVYRALTRALQPAAAKSDAVAEQETTEA